LKGVNIMDEDERMLELWRANKNKLGHKTTLKEFTEFCHEWDAICEKFRRLEGRE